MFFRFSFISVSLCVQFFCFLYSDTCFCFVIDVLLFYIVCFVVLFCFDGCSVVVHSMLFKNTNMKSVFILKLNSPEQNAFWIFAAFLTLLFETDILHLRKFLKLYSFGVVSLSYEILHSLSSFDSIVHDNNLKKLQ